MKTFVIAFLLGCLSSSGSLYLLQKAVAPTFVIVFERDDSDNDEQEQEPVLTVL